MVTIEVHALQEVIRVDLEFENNVLNVVDVGF